MGALAASALQAALATPGPGRRMAELAARQESSAAGRATANPEALRRRALFERDSRVFASRLKAELATIHGRYRDGVHFDLQGFASRDLLHVYGPDPARTRGPWLYRDAWGHTTGDFQGAGIGTQVDLATGVMSASSFSTGGENDAFAAIGMRLSPLLTAGQISVRPYVDWTGFDTLFHRVFDPQVNEQRWAVAGGKVGIVVESRLAPGVDFRTDARQWVEVWNRAEQNPSGSRDYAGLAGVATGLQLQVPTDHAREYFIWIVCWAYTIGDPGFAVATRASASIACHVPFVVVEETGL